MIGKRKIIKILKKLFNRHKENINTFQKCLEGDLLLINRRISEQLKNENTSIKYPEGCLIDNYIENAMHILDIGVNVNGANWYNKVNEKALIVGIDLYNKPIISKKNFIFIRMDAQELVRINNGLKVNDSNNQGLNLNLQKKFDLIVADHIFEHVAKPELLAKGINNVSQMDAIVHIGIPDPLNFTDIFYHLIHPDGGGHISFIKKEEMIRIMVNNGFELLEFKNWHDDWRWLEEHYQWKNYGVKYFSDEALRYIANVFRKELTPEKGYFYGGEYIFIKKNHLK